MLQLRKPVIDRKMRSRSVAPIMLTREQDAALGQPRMQGLSERHRDGIGDRGDALRIAPHHIVLVEIFGKRRDARGHHWRSARHRFEHGKPEALLDGRKHQRVGKPVERWHVAIRHRTEIMHRLVERVMIRQGCIEALPIGGVVEQGGAACNYKLSVAMNIENLLKRFESPEAILARLDTTDREQNGTAMNALFVSTWRTARTTLVVEADDMDAVSKDRGRRAEGGDALPLPQRADD